MLQMLLLASRLALLATAHGSWLGCSSAADCSYNGHCSISSRICECDPGWENAGCSKLSLANASRVALAVENGKGSGVNGTWVWGGHPLQWNETEGGDGKWHLFAALITNSCGLLHYQVYRNIPNS